jgi:hypothetical protein
MCKHGTVVPMPIGGRVRDIDSCIAHLIAALNCSGACRTIACCCGHGNLPGSILLEDGRCLVVMNREDHDRLFSEYGHDIHGTPKDE